MTEDNDTELVTIHGIQDGALIAEHEDGTLSAFSTLKEGEAIHGDLVELEPVEGQPRRYTCRTIYRHGPAKVSSDEYRTGWDATFGVN